MANHPSKNIKSLNRWTATPAPVNLEEVPNWIYRELNRLSDAMFNVDIMRLEQTNVDPGTEQGRRQKPRDGDIRYADGTNWNPNGQGQGIYWFDGTDWQPFGGGGSGGSPTDLDSLTDVTLTSPAPGEVLKYNGSQWTNAPDEVGAEYLDDLLDVNTSGKTTNDFLGWNGTSWVAAATSPVGFEEAPVDGNTYGRKDQTWEVINTFSGDYDDLTNKPDIPSDVSDLTDNTNLLEHFSGSYNDLTDKPYIPSDVGDLTDNGGLLGGFEEAPADGNDYVRKNNAWSVAAYFSGDYNDLTNKPSIPTDTGDLTDNGGLLGGGLEEAPVDGNEYVRKDAAWVINTDATFSGDYNDLSNKPDIPADVNDLTDVDGLLFSGDYNDLSNQPTIPTVNDATITFVQDGVEKGSFTLNQPNDETINVTDFVGIGEAPINQTQYARQNGAWAALNVEWQDVTQKPDLVEEAPIDSKKYVRENGAWVEDIDTHFSGDYNDLTNKPDIPTDIGQLTDSGNLLEHFSGDYNDLTNKPNIPIDVNDLTDIDGMLFSGDYNDLTNQPTIGDGSITINEAGVLKGTFTVNQSGNTIIDLDGPDGTGLGEAPTDGTDYVRGDGAWRAANYFSGVYSDLTGKPDIPSDIGDLTDTGNLLDGFSGDYNDLINQPTIPTVNDSTITFIQDGVTKGSFTLNQATDEDINITDFVGIGEAPIDGSEYVRKDGAWTLNTDATFSGDYNDLTNKPDIPSDVNDLTDVDGLLGGGGVEEAPNDGDKYVRQSESWVQLPSGAVSGLKWIDYATGFSTVPSVIDTVDNTNWSEEGDVYEYTYSNGTLYRVIGSTIDAFYNTFNAVANPALTGLVAQKSITI